MTVNAPDPTDLIVSTVNGDTSLVSQETVRVFMPGRKYTMEEAQLRILLALNENLAVIAQKLALLEKWKHL